MSRRKKRKLAKAEKAKVVYRKPQEWDDPAWDARTVAPVNAPFRFGNSRAANRELTLTGKNYETEKIKAVITSHNQLVFRMWDDRGLYHEVVWDLPTAFLQASAKLFVDGG